MSLVWVGIAAYQASTAMNWASAAAMYRVAHDAGAAAACQSAADSTCLLVALFGIVSVLFAAFAGYDFATPDADETSASTSTLAETGIAS
jgi:hypothetical protein